MTNRGRLIIKPSLKRPSAGGFSKGRETEEDRKKESAEAKEAKRIERFAEEGRGEIARRRSGCPWMLADRWPPAVNDLTTLLYPRRLARFGSFRLVSARLAWPCTASSPSNGSPPLERGQVLCRSVAKGFHSPRLSSAHYLFLLDISRQLPFRFHAFVRHRLRPTPTDDSTVSCLRSPQLFLRPGFEPINVLRRAWPSA